MTATSYKAHTLELVTNQVFEKLILPLKQKLYRFALSYLNNSAEAEDVVQDVMIKTWEDSRGQSAIRNIEAWCMTLVKHKSLDALKKAGRQYSEVSEHFELKAIVADPHEQTVLRQEEQLVHNAIAGLPEQQRQVIELRDVEGYSYKEISEILELEMNHVKVLLHRGRKHVRNLLIQTENYGSGEAI